MAKSYVCFDIGSDNLKMVELTGDSGSMQLKSFAVMPLEFTENMTNEDKNVRTAQTIRSILNEKRIRQKTISISISGQSVFTRFVQLPAVDESKVAQIIKYEAQQQVPFPIDEVEWDYQIIGDKSSEEINVVLVAVKKEIIMGIVEAIRKIGCDVETVSVAPLSIYNCTAYNEDLYSGATAVIDLGAKTTSLIVCEGDNLWSRNIPIGSENITQTLAKELNLSLADAENLKRESCVGDENGKPESKPVSPTPSPTLPSETPNKGGEGTETPPIAPTTPPVSETDVRSETTRLITGVCRRIISEVKRSVGFYRTQSKGSSIQRVLLSGGGLSLNNLREYFEDALKVPVERMFPVKKLSVSPEIDRAELNGSAHFLCDGIGLGIRSASKSRLSVNLLPKIIAYQKELSKKKVFIAGAAICLVAAMVALTMNLKKTKESGPDEEIKKLDIKIAALRPKKDKIGEIKKVIEQARSKLSNIKKLQDARLYWVDFIETLKVKKPKYAWFTEIEFGGVSRSLSVFIAGPITTPNSPYGPGGSSYRLGPPGGGYPAGPYGPGPGSYQPGPMGYEEASVKGDKGTVTLTGYLKMKKISTPNTETDLANQIEDLKRTLESIKPREELGRSWEKFNSILMPNKPTDKTLLVIYNSLKDRKSQLKKLIEGYLNPKKNTIPEDFMVEGALDELLDEISKELSESSQSDYEKLKEYNERFEEILSQFNKTAKSDFFGEIETRKSEPLDFKPGFAKFIFKANLKRPIEF